MTATQHAHCYCKLLKLLPRPFLEEFGYEMACDFSEGMERAVAAGSVATVALIWANSVSDLMINAVVQWLRTGIPMLIALAMCWSLLLFSLLAIQGVPQNRPEFADLHLAWLAGVLTLIVISIACSRYHTGDL
jgi:hypothetical protein